MLTHLEQYIINEAEVTNSEHYRTFIFIPPIGGIISESERRFIGNSGDWQGANASAPKLAPEAIGRALLMR